MELDITIYANEHEKRWKTKRIYPELMTDLTAIYRRDWINDQPLMPEENIDEAHSAVLVKRPLAHGLIYYLVRLLSQLYSRPVKRSSDQAAILEQIYWPNLNNTMHDADTWSRLYGTSLVGIYLSEDNDRPINHFTVSPRDFALGFDNNASKEPSWILIKYAEGTYHYWTHDRFIVLNKSFGVVSDEDNPIGQIPFVLVVTDRDPINPNVGLPFGGLDVVENSLAVARMLRELGWTAVLQRGQPWTDSRGASIVLAPDAIIELGNQGDTFGIEPNKANLSGMIAVLTELLSQFLMTTGLSPDLAIGSTSAAMSGVAIAISRTDIRNDGERRKELFRTVEERSLSLVNAWMNAEGYPVNFEQSINYPDLPVFLTFSEVRQTAQFLYSQGVISKRELVSRSLPHVSKEEADRMIAEAKLEKEQERLNGSKAD